MAETVDENAPKKRGLAQADAETRKRVTRAGGKAAQEKGTAHQWDKEAARQAAKARWDRTKKRQEQIVEDFLQGEE